MNIPRSISQPRKTSWLLQQRRSMYAIMIMNIPRSKANHAKQVRFYTK